MSYLVREVNIALNRYGTEIVKENETKPEDEQRPKRGGRQRESAENDTTPTEITIRQSQSGKRTIGNSGNSGVEEDEVDAMTKSLAVSLDPL